MNNINNIYENCVFNDITILKFEESDKYNVKYKNKTFVIEPKISFINCKLFSTKNNRYSIKFEINLLNNKHIDFKNYIRKIYDKLSECIEQEDNLIIDKIYNPINNSNYVQNIDVLYANINKNTKIINIENDEKIDFHDLINKVFIGYPIFYSPTLNKWNDNIYVNFSIYELHVKIIKEQKKDFNYVPNKQTILDSMNNINI